MFSTQTNGSGADAYEREKIRILQALNVQVGRKRIAIIFIITRTYNSFFWFSKKFKGSINGHEVGSNSESSRRGS
jgi:hypothetical protein